MRSIDISERAEIDEEHKYSSDNNIFVSSLKNCCVPFKAIL